MEKPEKARVLSIGSLNIDHVYSVRRLAAQGETVSVCDYVLCPGGKGLNQSIAAAKAGADVYHAGFVGVNGDLLLDALRKANVHTEHIVKTEGADGHAVIQVSEDGGNCILVYGGTNQRLTEEYIDGVLAQFKPGDIVMMQNETNLVEYILTAAHARGLRVACNASPICEALLRCPLELAEYLVVNEHEAEALTGIGAESGEEHLQCIRRLAQKYPRSRILMTVGAAGVYYSENGRVIHEPAFPVEPGAVRDTTGAGDTFLGYFLAGVVRGSTVEENLRRACAASGLAVQRMGASTGIPDAEEVEALLGADNRMV